MVMLERQANDEKQNYDAFNERTIVFIVVPVHVHRTENNCLRLLWLVAANFLADFHMADMTSGANSDRLKTYTHCVFIVQNTIYITYSIVCMEL